MNLTLLVKSKVDLLGVIGVCLPFLCTGVSSPQDVVTSILSML